METIQVSPEYEIVIPQTIREALNTRPGQQLQMIPYQGRIEIIPVNLPQAARGFLRGIDTNKV